ncbi:MAG: tRNA lysidine(34) synthetase TilS [Pseudomonadota bacterium]
MTEGSAPLHAALRGFFSDAPPNHLAVAISGGSDSLALLSLCHAWRHEGGPNLSAVTVDHGLRPTSAQEAAEVAQRCADWNIPHDTLHWTKGATGGNLQDQARRARYAMMAGWAATKGIDVIALGHTQDDQAETFLMRLARGSGLDGLSAMRSAWQMGDTQFARPLLDCSREALRDHLRAQNLTWVEDSSNTDPAYDRARVRAALPELGIGADTLSDVAGHLAQARDALHAVTMNEARKIARVEHGDVILDHAGLCNLHPDIARRLLLCAMRWINGADYPPRGKALAAVQADCMAGRRSVLQGCDISVAKGEVRITRELAAVATLTTNPDELWDGRWRLSGPNILNARVCALGEAGLGQCPDRARADLPARSLIASPAIWQGRKLIAAPLARLTNGWTASLVMRPRDDFAAAITH